jgi:hypothetical protein
LEFITNLIYHTCYWLQPFPRLQLPDGCDVILCITFRFVCYVISQILCCICCRLLLIQTLTCAIILWIFIIIIKLTILLFLDVIVTEHIPKLWHLVSQFMEWTFILLSIWQWLPDAVRRSETIWTHLILQTGENWNQNYRKLIK